MQSRLTNVGATRRVRPNLDSQLFKSPPPDIGQGASFRAEGRRLVEINRNPEATISLFPDAPGQRHAILQGEAFDRDKGHYVGGADPGMLAMMPVQVNQGRRSAHGAQD